MNDRAQPRNQIYGIDHSLCRICNKIFTMCTNGYYFATHTKSYITEHTLYITLWIVIES